MRISIIAGFVAVLFVTSAHAEDWAFVGSHVEELPYPARDGYPAITQKSKYDLYLARNSIRKSASQINATYVQNSTYLGPMVNVKVPKRSLMVNADFDCLKGAVRTWVMKAFEDHFGNGVMNLGVYQILNEHLSHDWERVTPGDDAYEVLNFLCK